MSHLSAELQRDLNVFRARFEAMMEKFNEAIEIFGGSAPRAVLALPNTTDVETSSQDLETSADAFPDEIYEKVYFAGGPKPKPSPAVERFLDMFDIVVLVYFNDQITQNHNKVLEIAEVYDQMRHILVEFSKFTALKTDTSNDQLELPDNVLQLINDKNRARLEYHEAPNRDNKERLRTLRDSVRKHIGKLRGARQLHSVLHSLELHAVAHFAATFDLNALAGVLHDTERATIVISRMLVKFAMSRKDFDISMADKIWPQILDPGYRPDCVPRSVAPRPLPAVALKQLELNYLFGHMRLYQPLASLCNVSNSSIPFGSTPNH